MKWFKQFWKALTTPVTVADKKANPSAPTTVANTFVRPSPSYPEAYTNFTPRAAQALALSRKEADRFNHNFVGTEHLLLGLIALDQGVAVTVLGKLGLNLESVRKEIEQQVGKGPDQKMIGNIPYTPRVKKVLALADKERSALNHSYLGTEHILLGLLREGDGVAARVFKNLDVNLEQTRVQILKELDPNYDPGKSEPPGHQTTSGSSNRIPVQTSTPAQPKVESIVVLKRFDIYCTEQNHDVVVYRNAAFKSAKPLLHETHRNGLAEFVELEQSDGHVVFVAKYSIIKFCEPGVTPNAEKITSPSKHRP